MNMPYACEENLGTKHPQSLAGPAVTRVTISLFVSLVYYAESTVC
jgi:hypothetical protein